MISVLIPSYNPTPLKLKLIYQNVININKAFNNDLELILVISCDWNHEYLEKYILSSFFYNKIEEVAIIKIFRFKLSASNARNIALDTSSKKYVYFLDDDDLIQINNLKTLELESINNPVVGITGTGVFSLSDLIIMNRMHHSNFIFLREQLIKWNDNFYPGEDWLFVAENIRDSQVTFFDLIKFKYKNSFKIYNNQKAHGYLKIVSDFCLSLKAKRKLLLAIKIHYVENKILERFDFLKPYLVKVIVRLFFKFRNMY